MRRMRAGRDAAPAGSASSAGLPGGLGAPPYGHYAGSLLDGRGSLRFASAARGQWDSHRLPTKTPR